MKHLSLLSILLFSCAGQPPTTSDAACGKPLANDATCTMASYPKRPYEVRLPPNYDAKKKHPVIFLMHGGGGHGLGALNQTCPRAMKKSPNCLHAMAGKRGYIVIAPNGTSNNEMLKNFRGWNSGGGGYKWRCTSGKACSQNADDMTYFDTLLDDVASRLSIDKRRVFLTGISNGGAISYRLACQRSKQIRGIVPIGGGNQFETTTKCEPDRPVATLHVHGTNDRCWRFEGGVPHCIKDQKGREHASIPDTLENLQKRNGCNGESVRKPMPDPKDDGTSSTRITYQGCSVPTGFIEVKNGGHTWPDGQQYLPEKTIGKVWRDWGNEVILDFFDSL